MADKKDPPATVPEFDPNAPSQPLTPEFDPSAPSEPIDRAELDKQVDAMAKGKPMRQEELPGIGEYIVDLVSRPLNAVSTGIVELGEHPDQPGRAGERALEQLGPIGEKHPPRRFAEMVSGMMAGPGGIPRDSAPNKVTSELVGAAGDMALDPINFAHIPADAASTLLGKVRPAMQGVSDNMAFKSVAGGQAKAFRNANGRAAEIGSDLRDLGISSFGKSVGQMADAAEQQSAYLGKQLGQLFAVADKAGPMVDGADAAREIRALAERQGGKGNRAVVDRMLGLADEYERDGLMTFEQAQKEKSSWNFDATGGDIIRSNKELSNAMKGAVGRAMEVGMDRFAQTPAAQALPVADPAALYKNMKRLYGSAEQAEQAATVLRDRHAKNRMFSLTDYLGAGTAAGAFFHTGDPMDALKVLGVATANKVARERGPQMLAAATDMQAHADRVNRLTGGLASSLWNGTKGLGVGFLSKGPILHVKYPAIAAEIARQIDAHAASPDLGPKKIVIDQSNPAALRDLLSLAASDPNFDTQSRAKLFTQLQQTGALTIDLPPEQQPAVSAPTAPVNPLGTLKDMMGKALGG
jgi:hypothetical protein